MTTERDALPRIVDSIEDPRQLHTLSNDQLRRLASEMRDIIIDAVNEHGGHLGSNLGVVELTIALYRVFTAPEDIVVWDTGHQTYPHKILTGRRDDFRQLREPDGLSGYPSRHESAHDWVENSHASTALAYTHGMALAAKLIGPHPRRVVAVIGDGSLTGGMAFEGLNNLGNTDTDCVIVLNDNGRSYAPTASRLGATLCRLLPEVFSGSSATARAIDAARRALDEHGGPPEFFESLGVGYLGPIDGHDIEAVEAALKLAADRPGPQLVHVITEKGRGYAPAENDIVKRLHDTSTAHADSYTACFGTEIVKLGAEFPTLMAITAAMPDSTGLLGFAAAFPDRFLDVGIAEQHAVTAAAGMAMGGLIPMVAIYSTFLTRALDQVINDVGLHRLPVIFCLDRAGITGDDGPSHHGVLDMALLSRVPGMTIFAPSSIAELRVMMRDAIAIATGPEPGPVAIRWSKTVPRAGADAPTGRGLGARQLRRGDDVCLIAVGKMVEAALAASELLETQGISTSVWDPRCVKPLDPSMLLDAATHSLVVTIEDGMREGGIGSAVTERIITMGLPSARRPELAHLGTPVEFIAHGKVDAIHAQLGLGPHGIAEQVQELVGTTSIRRAGVLR